MYKLELKSQPKTFIGRLNMVVPDKSQLWFTGLWSLKAINALTHTGVSWKLVGMLLKRKDENEF